MLLKNAFVVGSYVIHSLRSLSETYRGHRKRKGMYVLKSTSHKKANDESDIRIFHISFLDKLKRQFGFKGVFFGVEDISTDFNN